MHGGERNIVTICAREGVISDVTVAIKKMLIKYYSSSDISLVARTTKMSSN